MYQAPMREKKNIFLNREWSKVHINTHASTLAMTKVNSLFSILCGGEGGGEWNNRTRPGRGENGNKKHAHRIVNLHNSHSLP